MTVVAICLYLVGLLIMYVWGQINDGWNYYYFLWDKCKDLIFIMALHLTDPKYRWAIKPVIIFALIRFLWEIISTITGLDINHPDITGWLFILLALVCSFLTIKELLKWHRSNGR